MTSPSRAENIPIHDSTDLPSSSSALAARYFSFPSPTSLPSKGNYSSKVTIILKHIIYLSNKPDNIKSLLFSQWEDVLEIFAKAFDENNIGYARLNRKAGKAYKEDVAKAPIRFKDDPNCKVLIMNSKSQAVISLALVIIFLGRVDVN